jgi:threonine dehydrogenase-like Zn-dependent dehydrogenase
MPSIPRGIDWTSLWYKSLRVEGSYCYGWEDTPAGRKKTFEVALDLVRDKKVDLAPLITHRFPITRYRDAMKLLFGGKKGARVLKVAFSFANSEH